MKIITYVGTGKPNFKIDYFLLQEKIIRKNPY